MAIRVDAAARLDLLVRHDQAEPSVFLPANLLREARRQRGLPSGRVPRVCLLDPDGDVVRSLRRSGRGERSPVWACYHTELVETVVEGLRLGVVGCAVGAPFAVLVAEELFASGCDMLVSIASAGRVAAGLGTASLILIERALRGEGTSHRYLAPAPEVLADASLVAAAGRGLTAAGILFGLGATWTTDAPFRETPSALAAAGAAGAVAVEMEAAALLAFAAAARRRVVCFAHVTNQMAQVDGDFEKGPDDGAGQALAVMAAVAAEILGNGTEAR
jgi:uridine phosphorylase